MVQSLMIFNFCSSNVYDSKQTNESTVIKQNKTFFKLNFYYSFQRQCYDIYVKVRHNLGTDDFRGRQ